MGKLQATYNSRIYVDTARSTGKVPQARVDLSKVSLATDQIYDVVLEMVVPASPKNIDLGAGILLFSRHIVLNYAPRQLHGRH